jgi:hypothetical protein
VQALRAAGHPDRAAAVHALRRPTTVAWSINQVAREAAHRVEGLIGATDALEAAQTAATAGTAGDLRAATRQRRALIDELTDRALDHAGELGGNPAAQRDAIFATLDAASIDPEARVQLRDGRLTREVTRATGFGAISLTDPAPPAAGAPPRSSRAPERNPKRQPPDELARRRAEAVLADARDEAHAIGQVREEADAAHQDAVTEVDNAAERVRQLEESLHDARRALQEAKRAATAAAQDVTAAQTRQKRAAANLARAESRLSDAR